MLVVRRYGYRAVDVGAKYENQVDLPDFEHSTFPEDLEQLPSYLPSEHHMIMFDYVYGDAVHNLKNKLGNLARVTPANHETYEVRFSNGQMYWMKFSDWHLYFGGEKCGKILTDDYTTKVMAELK